MEESVNRIDCLSQRTVGRLASGRNGLECYFVIAHHTFVHRDSRPDDSSCVTWKTPLNSRLEEEAGSPRCVCFSRSQLVPATPSRGTFRRHKLYHTSLTRLLSWWLVPLGKLQSRPFVAHHTVARKNEWKFELWERER